MTPIRATYTPTPNEPREEVTIVEVLIDDAGDITFIFVSDDGRLGASSEFEAFSDCAIMH